MKLLAARLMAALAAVTLAVSGVWALRDVQTGSAAVGPPTLTLFLPTVVGLRVTLNGVTLPGTTGATVDRIHWDWGDGSEEDSWFPASHTYGRPGAFRITVTSYQSDALSSTRSMPISTGLVVAYRNFLPLAVRDALRTSPLTGLTGVEADYLGGSVFLVTWDAVPADAIICGRMTKWRSGMIIYGTGPLPECAFGLPATYWPSGFPYDLGDSDIQSGDRYCFSVTYRVPELAGDSLPVESCADVDAL